MFETLIRVENVKIEESEYPNHAFLERVKNNAILFKIIRNNVIIFEDLFVDLLKNDAKRKGQTTFSQEPV